MSYYLIAKIIFKKYLYKRQIRLINPFYYFDSLKQLGKAVKDLVTKDIFVLNELP